MRENESPSEQESRIEWWRRLIVRQQSTPVPLTRFCRQMGINPRKFYYWRKRLLEMDAASSGPPIPMSGSLQSASTVARDAAADFLPVSIIGRSAAIDIGRSTTAEMEIELANGCAIRIKGSVDPGLLQVAITATGQLGRNNQGDH
jgi:hypothetical protein